jgi:hypothetical protein
VEWLGNVSGSGNYITLLSQADQNNGQIAGNPGCGSALMNKRTVVASIIVVLVIFVVVAVVAWTWNGYEQFAHIKNNYPSQDQ